MPYRFMFLPRKKLCLEISENILDLFYSSIIKGFTLFHFCYSFSALISIMQSVRDFL